MLMIDIKRDKNAFLITWQDETVTDLPFIWLRDNDRDELHPDTHERVFDLTSVSIDIQPDEYDFTSKVLSIKWPNKTSLSNYQSKWLSSHKPGNVRTDASKIDKVYWTEKSLPKINTFNATECTQSTKILIDALTTLKKYGLIIIEGLEDNLLAGEEFGDLVGFKRRTNFDVMFNVVSKPNPVNLAYTSIALPLHTDLPNQSMIPSYQFLHCYRNSVVGGESVFADGFQICADMEKEEPKKFNLLK